MEQKQTWGLIFAVADRDKYEGLKWDQNTNV